MPGFEKAWAQQAAPSVGGKIRSTLQPQGALKPRIQNAVTKIQVQVAKIDAMLAKLRERDERLFARIVAAMQQHDTHASNAMSVELAEIRKVSKKMSGMRMALEQVQLRLTTMHELGDAMVELGPAMASMKDLKPALGKFMPEADTELNSMSQALSGMVSDSMTGDAFGDLGADANSEETARILSEASAVAEQQAVDKFPTVPAPGLASGAPSAQSTSTFE